MPRSDIEEVITCHGLAVDGSHSGAGHFKDLEIGVGAPLGALLSLQRELTERFGSEFVSCSVTRVNNKEHPQYQQPYLEVTSVWWA